MNMKDTKIKVDKQHFRFVEKAYLDAGCWWCGDREERTPLGKWVDDKTDLIAIRCDKDGEMTYWSVNDFNSINQFKELTARELKIEFNPSIVPAGTAVELFGKKYDEYELRKALESLKAVE